MKIAYITMQFPVPSETFLSSDVGSVVSAGHLVKVYGMRPNHKNHESMMDERSHQPIEVRNFTFSVFVDALVVIVRQPLVVVNLVAWIFKTCYKSPIHLVKSLILIPSAIGHYRDIVNYSPDIVHLFWGHYPSMIGHLVKMHDVSIVVTQFLGAHDLIAKYPGSRSFSEVSDKVFTHSEANMPMLRDFGINIDSVCVIHRGTRTDLKFSNLGKFDGVQSPVFLTASRLIKDKGVDKVIDIFSEVQSRHPSATLLIAGEGPEERPLKHKVIDLGLQKRIKFLGHISHRKLLEVMGSSHFFLLISQYPAERLPNVVKEAMLQQCTVVTTRSVGIDELVEHAKNGFIVQADDCRSAVDHLEYCIANPPLAKTIAENGRETIVEKFDVINSMKKYIEIWEQMKITNRGGCEKGH